MNRQKTLLRYDDSNAVMRLLQSRRRNSKDKEGAAANKEVGRKDSLLLAEAGRDALLLEEKETASSEHDVSIGNIFVL